MQELKNINLIVIHCSATVEGKDFRAADIRKWHIRDNGWADIGYHYVIDLDGTIERGRPVTTPGAHTKGHNTNSIGICYVGGLSASPDHHAKDTRTPAQKAALIHLLTALRHVFPKAVIRGHRDFAAKDCPCFDAKDEYKNI